MLLHDGRPWLGANFWSRSGGPLMWRGYDPDLIARELAVLAEHGMNLTRSFFYWPDFMPAPDRIDEEMVARYADFLDRHTDAGMATVPTFIVGHMSGENWDPVWRQGRDLYGDVWMVARQAWFVERMTARFHEHPAVAGWLISNEMPIYGERSPREKVTPWAQLMVQAVRAGGGTQPVSIGDGAWGMEITGSDNGFSVRDLGALTDFVGPHVYRMETDIVRQHLTAAFICELADFGKPVVLEEFGVTDAFVSRENAAHYYRQLLHNSLLAGATGWIGWNNSDYDNLHTQDPYRHHAFEMRFGLTDVEGNPKPALREFREFADVLANIDFPACARPDRETALVVPSYLEQDYPFTQPDDHTYVFEVLRQAYVAAREADLPVGTARERDGLPGDRKLYLLPSAKQLTGPAWRDLAAFAERGATVYASYSPGNHGVQRGLWHADVNGMFGVEHQLRYGLVDPITDDEVAVTFTTDFGSLGEGTTLTFRAGGNEHARSYLPVRATDAEVVAVDRHGNPVLLRRGHGAGHLVLCTFPLEGMAAALPHVNPEPTYRIYDALAAMAGVSRPVTVADPLVHAAELRHRDGRRFVWLVSQAAEELRAKPVVTRGRLADLVTGEPVDEVTLRPYGVRVLALEDF
ncbi:cellulase family glycosylhydrolase [Actinophytocola sp.]|uniref:cellulase family glycosylhydrolase n=1 Tax=Actinophytocola sp. TaxID=1872138 RepID=UPI00389A8E93